MLIQIDNASDRAVYQQIIDHIKRDIALGRLKMAEKLPTVRELASLLVINPNTIAKAYRQLEQEGIIVTKAGAGAFVASLDSHLSRAVRKRLICEQIEHVVVDAFHMQVDREALIDWFNNAIEKFNLSARKV